MWWTGNAVGFDLETDGRDPTDARIITAAMVGLSAGSPPGEAEVLLQPERDIPAEASRLHGITTEHAREHGTPREVAVLTIVATLAEALGPEVPMVCHNAPYDLTVLDRELRRMGVGSLGCTADDRFVDIWIGRDRAARFPVIDTLVLDKAVDRYRPGKRKLEVAAAHYGVPMAEGAAHGATADVIAALRIAITIANRCAMPISAVADLYMDRRFPMKIAEGFYDLGAMSLPELHTTQVRWAREQAAGLREHFLEQGKVEDAAGVSGEWPLRTLREDETTETISTDVL